MSSHPRPTVTISHPGKLEKCRRHPHPRGEPVSCRPGAKLPATSTPHSPAPLSRSASSKRTRTDPRSPTACAPISSRHTRHPVVQDISAPSPRRVALTAARRRHEMFADTRAARRRCDALPDFREKATTPFALSSSVRQPVGRAAQLEAAPLLKAPPSQDGTPSVEEAKASSSPAGDTGRRSQDTICRGPSLVHLNLG